MRQNFSADVARYILYCAPDAIAWIIGTKQYPNITGKVYFWQMEEGVFVEVEARGLPDEFSKDYKNFTICIQDKLMTKEKIFTDVNNDSNLATYNSTPIGQLPPLYSNNGVGWYATLINQFIIEDIIGCELWIKHDLSSSATLELQSSNLELASGIIKINVFS